MQFLHEHLISFISTLVLSHITGQQLSSDMGMIHVQTQMSILLFFFLLYLLHFKVLFSLIMKCYLNQLIFQYIQFTFFGDTEIFTGVSFCYPCIADTAKRKRAGLSSSLCISITLEFQLYLCSPSEDNGIIWVLQRM